MHSDAAPFDALTPQESGASSTTIAAALLRLGSIRGVWRQWWVVASSIVLCGLIAAIYLFVSTPIYTSTSRIYVEPATVAPKAAGLNSAPAGAISQNFLNTQRELVHSTPVLALALARPGVENLQTLAGARNPLDDLRRRINVRVGKTDDLIYVSLDSPYDTEAADLVNSVVEAYVSYTSKQRHTTASDLLSLLAKAKDERENELTKKTAAFLEFKKTHGAVARAIPSASPSAAGDAVIAADRANLTADRIAAMTQVLTAAQIDSLNAKSAYDEAIATVKIDPEQRQRIESGEATSAESLVVDESQLRNRLYVQQSKLQDLRRTYRPDHPLCKNAQKLVDDLSAAYIGSVYRHWQSAQHRETELKKSIDGIRTESTASDADVVEYARLESEMKQSQRTVELLEDRLRTIDLGDGSSALNITVIDPAMPADAPSSPAKAATMGTALLIGLVLGIGGAVARQLLDQRMQSVTEIESTLDAPIVGVLPQMPQSMTPAARALQPHLDRTSGVAEACRAARMAIKHRLGTGGARIVAVASPSAGDGRSTVVANLAITMAQAGDRVLVVDGNLFNPSQHQIFALGNFHGVTRVLGESLPYTDAIRPTNIDKLDVLPAGPASDSASDLLNSQAFGDLLGDLAGRYDYVLVDSPPAAAGAAARIVAAACDATILVINVERSNRKLSQDTLHGLLNVGANVIGVVVNELRTESPRYGYAMNPAARPQQRPPRASHPDARHVAGSNDDAHAAQTAIADDEDPIPVA